MAQNKAFSLGGIGAPCCCGGGGGGSLSCLPCNIPTTNLTLSYVNSVHGNGSTTLTYASGTSSWASGCVLGNLFKLLCTGGEIELRAIYFTAGSCPSGTQQYCSNLRSSPLALSLYSYTCSPFSLTFKVTSAGCSNMTNNGYSQFTVTQ